MRILLVHNLYKQPGGEDVVLMAEYKLLLNHGHTVEKMVYHNSVIASFFDKLMAGLRSIYNPDSARAFRNKIQSFNPDVIHVHNFLPLVSPSVFFAARKFNVPIVLTLHNYRLICPSATLFYKGSIYENSIRSVFPLDAVWKGVYRNSRVETAGVALMTAVHKVIGTWRNKITCYIALTQFSKMQFEMSTLSIPSDKLLVKSNFVEDCGVGERVREKFFLFIGRLTEEKGVRMLLKAAGLRKFRLLIIGDGPLRELVEKSARQNSNIEYLGLQEKSTVISYLKKCRALIFPSIWYEGFPMTILEAFSTGTPVIASNLGSMKEIVQHNINGLHFMPGIAEDLVSKIDYVGENDSIFRSMAANARSSYLELYTPEKNYGQLMGVYNYAMEQCPKKESWPNRLPELRFKEQVDA